MRAVPVEVVDVPGLIEGASQGGKGMGNEFLDALRNSDAIINLFDGTSVRGGGKERLAAQAEEVEREIVTWFADRMARDWERFSRRADASGERIERSLHTKLASFGLSEADISTCLSKGVFPQRLSIWGGQTTSMSSLVRYSVP
ncbi:50S ribosome-binding GTPase [Thermogymnomonas acidicola]|uniref:GTPase n=1 Tax=Thermogymnomonas acidicola TaxID=399579 RepID=UPI000A969CD3|nr:GTPase [Thermogymnomonas acidicola]